MVEIKFKVGDVIKLANDGLIKHGWYSTMLLQITSITKNAYRYTHINDGGPSHSKGTTSSWSYEIIHENFELDKTATVLYGKN